MAKYMLFSSGFSSPSVYLSAGDIITFLDGIMPAKGINYGKAAVFTKWIFYVLTAYSIYLVVAWIYFVLHKKKFLFRNKVWLVVALLLLLLTFILPDSKGEAVGFITARCISFFFLFLIIWLACQDVALWFKVIIFIIVNYINFALVLHNFRSVSKGCQLADEIHATAQYIEPYSVILPLLSSDNFLYGHISNYMGADKPIVILENYEAFLNHFPLKWNREKISGSLLDNLPLADHNQDWEISANQEKLIDYVMILNDNHHRAVNPFEKIINNSLNPNYNLIFTNPAGTIFLFRKKA